GTGWTAANSLVWNSIADSIEATGPPGAENAVRRSTESRYESQLLRRLGHKVTPLPFPQKEQSVSDFRNAGKPNGDAPNVTEVSIVNGRFVADGKVIWGGMVN